MDFVIKVAELGLAVAAGIAVGGIIFIAVGLYLFDKDIQKYNKNKRD